MPHNQTHLQPGTFVRLSDHYLDLIGAVRRRQGERYEVVQTSGAVERLYPDQFAVIDPATFRAHPNASSLSPRWPHL